MFGERGETEASAGEETEVIAGDTAQDGGRVTVEAVSAATFDAVLRLQVAPEQQQFVASNVLSLAQAWLWPSSRPLALLVEGAPVGFALVDTVPARRGTASLVRFMVDAGRQGNGFGRRGLTALLTLLAAEGYRTVQLSYVPGNTVARRLYAAAGFVETGEVDDGETVMRLRLAQDGAGADANSPLPQAPSGSAS